MTLCAAVCYIVRFDDYTCLEGVLCIPAVHIHTCSLQLLLPAYLCSTGFDAPTKQARRSGYSLHEGALPYLCH